jgi:hypothetical protein
VIIVKKVIIWVACVVIAISIGGLIFYLNMDKVDTMQISNGEIRFVYRDSNMNTKLSDEDEKYIKEIFNKRQLYKDNPSCGFSENVSILFNEGNIKFFIAQDSCPILYYANKDKYFKLTDDEAAGLCSLLEDYGFVFPCI